MKKVILMDVDGTLANGKKEITAETREALLKAQDAGALLVLASGRTANGLKKFERALAMEKHNGLLVCSNGSQVVNCETGDLLYNKALTVAEGKEVLEHLKNFDVCPMIAKGDYMYVNDVFHNTINFRGKPFNVMQYESRSNNYLLCEIADLAQWCDFEINKILTFGEPEYLQAHYEEMAAPFKGRVNSMFTSPFYYEYTAKDIDKTAAIKASIESLGYTAADMIAFGDAQNDASMVQYAGVGVAMGNATQELKDVADYITDSNEEDGIAHALYKLLPDVYQ